MEITIKFDGKEYAGTLAEVVVEATLVPEAPAIVEPEAPAEVEQSTTE